MFVMALSRSLVRGGLRVGPASVFVIIKTTDTNDGVCDADGSLREAVKVVSAAPGADMITVPALLSVLSESMDEETAAIGDLDINERVTLAGAGLTITDGAHNQVFPVNSAGVPDLSATMHRQDMALREEHHIWRLESMSCHT